MHVSAIATQPVGMRKPSGAHQYSHQECKSASLPNRSDCVIASGLAMRPYLTRQIAIRLRNSRKTTTPPKGVTARCVSRTVTRRFRQQSKHLARD